MRTIVNHFISNHYLFGKALKNSHAYKRKLKIGFTCLFLVCVILGFVFGTHKRSTRAKEIQLFNAARNLVSSIDRAACFVEATDEGRYSEYQCLKRCGYVRHLPPEPVPHQACMVGCGGGTTAALSLGCDAVLSADACNERARHSCTAEHCSGFSRNAELSKICFVGCEEMVAIACNRAVGILGEKRRGNNDETIDRGAEL